MALAWFLRVFSNSSDPRPWRAAQTQERPAWSPWLWHGSCEYSRTPQTLGLGALLRLKRGLHGVHGSGMVLASILELLLLLGDLAVNLLLDLAQLQLSSQHLVLPHGSGMVLASILE